VQQGLDRAGLTGEAAHIAAGLEGAIQAPILPGLRLADLAPSDRLNELDFDLSVAPSGRAITPAALAQVLRKHPLPHIPMDYPDRLAGLSIRAFRGYLNGSIDLVFRVGEVWHLADHKSNNLGPSTTDYTPQRMGIAMADAHYVLQAIIYQVALHQYLRWRVPDRVTTDLLGGVFYLFLRGMHPDHPANAGVWGATLSAAAITDLVELFEGGSP